MSSFSKLTDMFLMFSSVKVLHFTDQSLMNHFFKTFVQSHNQMLKSATLDILSIKI